MQVLRSTCFSDYINLKHTCRVLFGLLSNISHNLFDIRDNVIATDSVSDTVVMAFNPFRHDNNDHEDECDVRVGTRYVLQSPSKIVITPTFGHGVASRVELCVDNNNVSIYIAYLNASVEHDCCDQQTVTHGQVASLVNGKWYRTYITTTERVKNRHSLTLETCKSRSIRRHVEPCSVVITSSLVLEAFALSFTRLIPTRVSARPVVIIDMMQYHQDKLCSTIEYHAFNPCKTAFKNITTTAETFNAGPPQPQIRFEMHPYSTTTRPDLKIGDCTSIVTYRDCLHILHRRMYPGFDDETVITCISQGGQTIQTVVDPSTYHLISVPNLGVVRISKMSIKVKDITLHTGHVQVPTRTRHLETVSGWCANGIVVFVFERKVRFPDWHTHPSEKETASIMVCKNPFFTHDINISKPASDTHALYSVAYHMQHVHRDLGAISLPETIAFSAYTIDKYPREKISFDATCHNGLSRLNFNTPTPKSS
jgi:hypothetical protein